MAEETNDRIRKFIIKNLVGKIGYSSDTQSFQLVLRQTRTDDRERFRNEIKKYPSWQMSTDLVIDKFIDDVKTSIGLCRGIHRATKTPLHLDTLKPGNIISLFEHDGIQGDFELRILFMGASKSKYRFFVLSSNRTALLPEDVLEAYSSDVWSVDHIANFIVYRDGKRIPHHKELIYQTYPLIHITLESPSIIHEVIDARSDFSYDEYKNIEGTKGKNKLSFKQSPMSLLLREFSSLMPYYADINEDGREGKYYKNSPSNILGNIWVDNNSMELKIIEKS